ncbi:hypothetical protein [Thiohalomonas denitrificans]|uniref:hypothetical protein n=1 Tax=Thiohalomonas denitrificans TaxID=415747 RepID=UPI0026F01D89|nr:hypothetical protein [Thiohalomonas denitrificans]
MIQSVCASKRLVSFIGFMISFSASAYGAGLSCPDSQKMVCLGYGDKIVGDNAVCFDRFECSQEGFVCKSELDDLANEYEGLLDKQNELTNRYNELVGVYESTVTDYRNLKRCVEVASTLKDVQVCTSEL